MAKAGSPCPRWSWYWPAGQLMHRALPQPEGLWQYLPAQQPFAKRPLQSLSQWYCETFWCPHEKKSRRLPPADLGRPTLMIGNDNFEVGPGDAFTVGPGDAKRTAGSGVGTPRAL